MRGRDFFRQKAGRRDANHAKIRDGLRQLGYLVVDLAAVGDGVPDLLVLARHSTRTIRPPWFLEVKTPEGKLNPAQIRWAARAASFGNVHCVRSLDDALTVIGLRQSDGKRTPRTSEMVEPCSACGAATLFCRGETGTVCCNCGKGPG